MVTVKSFSAGCLRLAFLLAPGAFMVLLLAQAFKGDVFAIGLAVSELLILLPAFFIDEQKKPKWLVKVLMWSTRVWASLAVVWLLSLIF